MIVISSSYLLDNIMTATIREIKSFYEAFSLFSIEINPRELCLNIRIFLVPFPLIPFKFIFHSYPIRFQLKKKQKI